MKSSHITRMSLLGTIAILYGGGQIPTANQVISIFAQDLLQMGYKVYGVHKSFLGLGNIECYERLNIFAARNIAKYPGTNLSTCRKVDPSDDKWFYDILNTLKSLNIHTILLPGGDGSSRAAVDLVERSQQEGYTIQVIFVPCTIDGIPNSEAIGFPSSVKESLRHVTLITVNSFATWNPNFILPRVALIEIQGRNRNDILLKVIRIIIDQGCIGPFKLEDINIILLPTAYEWSINVLLTKIYDTNKPTLILMAEGAEPVEKYWNAFKGDTVGDKLKNIIVEDGKMEVNFDRVGYLSQTNDQFSESEIKTIKDWSKYSVYAMMNTRESIAIVKNGDKYSTMLLTDFARETNSREGVELSQFEKIEFESFLP